MPDPLRPENRPDMVQLRPPADPVPDTDPFGLTWPVPYCPTSLPLEITTASVELAQVAPTLRRIHAPSRLPAPPPPLFRDARLGASASRLLRLAGLEGSAARGVAREPDSDFSSLPMLPPALPDCACAKPATAASVADSKAALVKVRMMFGKIEWLPINGHRRASPSAQIARTMRRGSPLSLHASSPSCRVAATQPASPARHPRP